LIAQKRALTNSLPRAPKQPKFDLRIRRHGGANAADYRLEAGLKIIA